MKIPRIFLRKSDPIYWDEYWKRSRLLKPRDMLAYFGRTIPTKEIYSFYDKDVGRFERQQRFKKLKNSIIGIFKKDRQGEIL